MKAALRGTEIYFDVAGMQLRPKGTDFIEKPVLFMLHGGPGGDHLRFKQHSLELQEEAQLVFIDHRGCGRSKKTQQSDYSLENNIEDVEALRKHLGLKTIALMGTSYGGMVAQGYACRYPQHLSKLILVVTAPSFRFLEDARANLERYATPAQKAISQHLINGTFKSHEHVMKYFKLMDPLYCMAIQQNPKLSSAKSPTIWSHQALNEGVKTGLRHFDFLPKLKKITCPTLVLGGDHDWICPAAQSRLIAKAIPQAKLKIFKNCGHAIAVDAHVLYIKTINAFLRQKTK